MTHNRTTYWSQEIAFNCPITGKRHSIDYCFKHCHQSDYNYLEEADHHARAFMYCREDPQNRYLHDGKAQRKL